MYNNIIDIMNDFISLLEIVFLVIFVEWIIVFIMLKSGLAFKFMPKPDKKDYSVVFDNNGWNFHIPAQNPLDFFDMIIKKFNGDDATTQEYIQQNIKNIIKSKSKKLIENTLEKSQMINKKVNDLVLEQITQELNKKEKK